MKEPFLVSIFVLTYNHEKYIAQAIEGILMQKTDFKFEIVIGEDCSTDNTRNIILEYDKLYPGKFKLLLHEKNIGAAANQNAVFAACTGKYIALCEGDDYWTDPYKLQKQVDFLEKNEDYSMCFHETKVVDEKGKELYNYNKISKDRDFKLLDLIKKNFICTSSVFFRSKNIIDLPNNFKKLEAGDWGINFLNAQFGKLKYLHECMSVYLIHSNGVWSSLSQKEMIVKGVKVMEQLNELTNYKYSKHFDEGIKKRLNKIEPLVKENAKKNYDLLSLRKTKHLSKNKKVQDNFTVIPFTKNNLDRYIIRTTIFNAITSHLNFFNGNMLDVGCGKMPYKHYILENSNVEQYDGLDIENAKVYDNAIKPDFYWDGINMPFKNKTYNTIIATEVLEHCPDPMLVMSEIYRVLDKDGIFFFTVPFLWNLHEVPHDEYRYTPFALQRILADVGFDTISIEAGGGWHASLAQMLGLWVRRSPMRKWQRNLLSSLLKPIIGLLIKKDKKIGYSFKEGHMITNIFGYARKK